MSVGGKKNAARLAERAKQKRELGWCTTHDTFPNPECTDECEKSEGTGMHVNRAQRRTLLRSLKRQAKAQEKRLAKSELGKAVDAAALDLRRAVEGEVARADQDQAKEAQEPALD